MYKQINVTDLSSEDLYLLMEEILSDVSEISEGENKSNEMGVELHPNVNMNYFSNDEAAINNVAWESEDELPLTAFIATKEKVGPNLPDDLEYPVEYFFHLFCDTLLNTIAFQTNLYATQKYCKNGYHPTTLEETKCFLGINLLMGKLPSYRDFWSSRMELRDLFYHLV
ncbi:transposase is4 [Holotrichia oblita]|uniref:Transposase is4 n=1 Tax=Holotrichia oblita TaxID=644536 RepID=A0ACB9SQF5_HOLOL|nr:transposase is4 [Holotrichia oblita]